MSRTLLPFDVGDISALARSLREQLVENGATPSHLELLNMLARSAGHRNFQSFRAQLAARRRLDQPPPPKEPVDYVQVRRLAGYFDEKMRLKSWPAKSSQQETCLWVLWSQLPARQALNEDQLNRQLRAMHLFGDHALLRRELCDRGLVSRAADGREYRRIEREPAPGAIALIRGLTARSAV